MEYSENEQLLFTLLQDEDTPEFGSQDHPSLTVFAERQIISGFFNYLDDINESKNKLEIVQSYYVEPILNKDFLAVECMGTSLNAYDKSLLTIAEMKLLKDLDVVEEYLERVKFLLTK